MCGIFGFTGPEDRQLLKKMSKVMLHRGPDEQGFYFGRRINLGANRLSIIGLSKGKQPIPNEKKNIWVSFNGEIYNFQELKKKLKEKNHKFSFLSDTEVIVHLYEEYGLKFIDHLDGMFSIALWDSLKKRLILVRDRVGKKPLYYTISNKNIFFASEIKSILENKAIKREVDKKSLSYYLSYSYVPERNTLFQKIKRLLPGEFLIFEKGKIKLHKYWSPKFDPSEDSEEAFLKKLDSILKSSIQKRLLSEVPLGVYLSGGIDSSTIVYYMSQLTNNINTISVGFGNKHDEVKYARKIARKFKTNHKEIFVKEDIVKYLPQMVWHLDDLISDPAFVPVFFISKATKKYATVILSGEGGDEIFAGYPHHKTLRLVESHKKKIPLIFRNMIRSPMKFKKYRVGRYFTYLFSNRIQMYFNYLSNFNEAEKNKLLKVKQTIDSLQPIKKYFSGKRGFLTEMQDCDLNNLMAENFNMKVDKMASSQSLEARCPLLDYKLVDFMGTVPERFKMNSYSDKYLLRKLMRGRLPPEIIKRKKHGFDVPLDKWFRTELGDYAKEVFLKNKNVIKEFFNETYFNKIIKNIKNKSEKEAQKVWSLLLFILWHNTFISGKKQHLK